jgi:hypothetical protein
MALRDGDIHKAAATPKHYLPVALVTAISQTGVVAYSFTPGYRFQIAAVSSYCRVKAGTVTATVKIGSRTAVTTVSFTTATELAQTLSTTLANIRGSSTETITIEYTTDGSGVLTNGFVTLTIRPFPLSGETGPNS